MPKFSQPNVKPVERLVRGLQHICGNEKEINRLVDCYFDPEKNFYEEIREYKSYHDTYSVNQHTIEVDLEHEETGA